MSRKPGKKPGKKPRGWYTYRASCKPPRTKYLRRVGGKWMLTGHGKGNG